MKRKFILFSACLLILTSCQFSISTHSFEHYGTDALRQDADFFYVALGLTGSSSAKYTTSGGGHVRNGLIADAKMELHQKHPLKPNQAYVNMSIDVITTQNGVVFRGGKQTTESIITVVVYADVIEYGTPSFSDDYTPLKGNINTLDPDHNKNKESVLTKSVNKLTVPPTQIIDTNDPADQIDQIKVGDKVMYKSLNAEVIQVALSANQVKIEYQASNGKTKKQWVYLNYLTRILDEN